MGRLTTRTIFLCDFWQVAAGRFAGEKMPLVVTANLSPRGGLVTAKFQNRQSGPKGSWVGCIQTTIGQ